MIVATSLAALALLGADVAAVPSGAQVLEPAFGGTIVSTYADGSVSKLWLNRDGTFTSEGRHHDRRAGRWIVKGHDVCLSQLKPFPIPFASYCQPIPAVALTDTWTGKAVTGEPITNRLVAER
ncbi:hypothetical protein [Caulobacter sp. S45]|uniref:hypothetical protein n=1 Tax=Caulobacter sp. S45 TaxID=1641861 RepID=UPI0015753EF6|nr:hypothetical protein [Caulobacter sp. S45]